MITADIVVDQNGKIAVITRTGDFNSGERAIKQLISELEAAGIDLQEQSQVEQHIHTPEHVHQKDRVR